MGALPGTKPAFARVSSRAYEEPMQLAASAEQLCTAGPDVPIARGHLVGGRYVVDDVLAEGGMGVVYLATHTELGQRVAIKFLRGDFSGRESLVQRFLNEARAAATLRSEHVVRVMDVGQLECGRPYLVMEHLEGIDLDALVQKEGPRDRASAALCAAGLRGARRGAREGHRSS